MSQSGPRSIPRSYKAPPPSLAGILGLSGSDSDLSVGWVAESVRMVSLFWPLFLLAKICLMLVTVNLPLLVADYEMFDLPLLAVTAIADLAIWVMPRRSAGWPPRGPTWRPATRRGGPRPMSRPSPRRTMHCGRWRRRGPT